MNAWEYQYAWVPWRGVLLAEECGWRPTGVGCEYSILMRRARR